MSVRVRCFDPHCLETATDSSPGYTIPGTLWLHAMPARRDDGSWDDFMAAAKAARIETILCLCSRDEIKIQSPAYAKALKEPDLLEGIAVREFAIPDYQVPRDEAGFINFIRQAADDLSAGRQLILHCGAGIGRTGLTAACILSALGMESEAADSAVADAEAGAETPKQQAFLARIRSVLARGSAAAMPAIEEDDDMLEEYDFSNGIRGKYVQRPADIRQSSPDLSPEKSDVSS